MERAQTHISVIQPAIRADARFDDVQLTPFTKDNGTLLVIGSVASDEALRDLRRIIDKSNPPVPMTFAVVVLPDEPPPK
jgi:hypothetical protein